MIMYRTIVNIYIDDKDTEKVKEFCKKNDFGFEDDRLVTLHSSASWQEHYRKLTGFSGLIKSCWITQKTLSNPRWEDIVIALNKADFDAMISVELS